MGRIGYPETSIWNYHSTLCNFPEEFRSHLHRGRSLKSLILLEVIFYRTTLDTCFQFR